MHKPTIINVETYNSMAISFGDSPSPNTTNNHSWATNVSVGFAKEFTFGQVEHRRGIRD